MTEQQEDFGAFTPYDIEVEQTVLATLLTFDDTLPIVSALIEPADFYDPLHARIFEKMLVLEELERPITPRTMHAVMKNDPGIGDLKKAAGDKWGERDNYLVMLADVVRPVPVVDELKDLARTIGALAVRRQAIDALADANDRLERGSKIETALASVVKVADQVALAEVHRTTSPELGDAFERLAREMDSAGTRNRGLMTPWEKLNKLLGGLLPETLTVVAGRPGMGKSIFGTNLLRAAGAERDDQGCTVWLPTGFSLEMSQAENVARIIAEIDFRNCLKEGRTDPIHYSAIAKNRLSADQFTRYVLIGQTLRELGIEVYDQARMTMGRIRAIARARQALAPDKKVFCVIDHLQIVGVDGKRKGSNRIEDLTEISGLAKELAKALKAPVVALSQLSRGVEGREDKRPLLSDLRESGSIEQDADTVLMLYRPEYYLRHALRHARNAQGKAETVVRLENQLERDANKLDVDAAKHRHGSVGDVSLWVDVASGCVLNDAPGMDDGPQAALPLGGEPLNGLDDLAKRTGTE
jgi:replicative DNA helicase